MSAPEKVSGIYEIRNTLNDKVYVGSSSNVKARWRGHLSGLRAGKHPNAHLQRAWVQQGESVFVFSVLEEVEAVAVELARREQVWMDNLDCCNPEKGYNLALVAGKSMLGLKHTDAARRRMSEGQKRRCEDPAVRLRVAGLRKGKKASEATRGRVVKALQTRWADPASRRKLLTALVQARWADEEDKEKASQLSIARWTAPGVKETMSQAMSDAWAVPGERERRSAAIKKGRADPKVRAKLSALAEARWADPEFRKKMAVVNASPEVSARRSEGRKRAWATRKAAGAAR